MPEPNYEARMSQMEKLLETSVKILHEHTTAINEIRQDVSTLKQDVSDLREEMREQARDNAESFARLTHQMGELTSIFQESVALIRGVQLENRRIIERVFGQDE